MIGREALRRLCLAGLIACAPAFAAAPADAPGPIGFEPSPSEDASAPRPAVRFGFDELLRGEAGDESADDDATAFPGFGERLDGVGRRERARPIGLGEIFAERERLDPQTHLDWLSSEPWTLASPDHYLRRLCGEPGAEPWELDAYADCIDVVRGDFDHAFYEVLFPEAMERMATLKSLGLGVTDGNAWLSAQLPPHRVHTPSKVADFFATRSGELRREADRLRREQVARRERMERDARIEAERRREAAARARAADRQQKIALCAAMNASLPNAYQHCAQMLDAQGDAAALARAARVIEAELEAELEAERRRERERVARQQAFDAPWKAQLAWQAEQRERERQGLADARAVRPPPTAAQQAYAAAVEQWRGRSGAAYEGFDRAPRVAAGNVPCADVPTPEEMQRLERGLPVPGFDAGWERCLPREGETAADAGAGPGVDPASGDAASNGVVAGAPAPRDGAAEVAMAGGDEARTNGSPGGGAGVAIGGPAIPAPPPVQAPSPPRGPRYVFVADLFFEHRGFAFGSEAEADRGLRGAWANGALSRHCSDTLDGADAQAGVRSVDRIQLEQIASTRWVGSAHLDGYCRLLPQDADYDRLSACPREGPGQPGCFVLDRY